MEYNITKALLRFLIRIGVEAKLKLNVPRLAIDIEFNLEDYGELEQVDLPLYMVGYDQGRGKAEAGMVWVYRCGGLSSSKVEQAQKEIAEYIESYFELLKERQQPPLDLTNPDEAIRGLDNAIEAGEAAENE